MKKFGKRMICGVMTAGLALAALTGCGSQKIDGTKTVAKVDGVEIPMGVASFLARYQQAGTEAMYQQMMGAYGGGQDMDIWDGETEEGITYGEQAKESVETLLNQLYLLEKHAPDYGVTLTEEEKAAAAAAAEGFISANSQEVLDKIGASQEHVQKALELQTIQSKMFEPMTADVDTEISDEEANQSRVTLVTVSTKGTEKDEEGNTIALTDEEKAAKKEQAGQVLEMAAAAGAEGDLDALAKEVDENLSASERTYTTASAKEEGTLDEAVLDAASGLTDGQVYGEVVETEDGYVVVRMDKVLDEEATESKRESILNTRKQDLYTETLDGWVEEMPIEMVDSVWKKLKITDKESFLMKTAQSEEAAQ